MSNTFIDQGLYSSHKSGLVLNGIDHATPKTYIAIVYLVRFEGSNLVFGEFFDSGGGIHSITSDFYLSFRSGYTYLRTNAAS